ncbi:MAG: Gfo/Idh/MocA family oxidoreductase [Hyphomonadaceae bacterium]|nr:Gfo/Idh/MocA family oxidoreductase [Hyphomonadaceae bacterium]
MTLRIGLLGASRIAPLAILEPAKHISGIEVVAVAARDSERARAFAATHGIAHAAASYDELIARNDVDLIYNALPIPLHETWTIAALAAGKHVLLEKPSAPTSKAAQRMVECAKAKGTRLIEAFHYRYHPLFERILALAGSELGALKQAHAVIDVPVPQRPGEIRWDPAMSGGALMDLGCYPVHWLRTLGGELTIVTADITMAACGVDESALVQFRLANGADASLHCSMVPHDRGRLTTLTLTGQRGELFVRNPIAPQMGHELRWRLHGEADWCEETAVITTSYFHQLSAVALALRSGAALPTEGDDIVQNLAALEAIYEAGGHPRNER